MGTKKNFEGKLPQVKNPNRPKPGPGFEGPLKPGKNNQSGQRGQPAFVVGLDKLLKQAEARGYRRGKKAGFLKGHAEGYALGIKDEKKNQQLRPKPVRIVRSSGQLFQGRSADNY
jgi:hypothetical protein